MRINIRNYFILLGFPIIVIVIIRIILIYGPDTGLALERLDTLTRTIVEDIRDPFLVAEFNGSRLKDDNSLLIKIPPIFVVSSWRGIEPRLITESISMNPSFGYLASCIGIPEI